MTIIDMDKMGEALNTKADIDLNNTGVFSTSEGGVVNLTSSTPANASGKEVTSADFLQSNLLNYTTNRILEIPQDIKLELNNGTLTLKAGSKVYVPNGFEADGTTPKFDEVVITTDLHHSATGVHAATDRMVFVVVDKSTMTPVRLGLGSVSTSVSGTTAPSSGYFYNTSNNTIKYYNNSTAQHEDSFPICIGDISGPNSWSSISQIFNGFGYIGSTVFALPGVKVQIPNGINEDGTFKSFITTTARISTWTWDGSSPVYDIIDENGLVDAFGIGTHFDYEKNFLFLVDGTIKLGCIISKHNHTPRVENFEPYSVDSVLNSNLSNLSPAGEAKLKSNIQLVNELPANPEPGVLYCIPEA